MLKQVTSSTKQAQITVTPPPLATWLELTLSTAHNLQQINEYNINDNQYNNCKQLTYYELLLFSDLMSK